MCAVIKQGILGAFSGKVGGVVGTSWKGIAVMKSLPPSVSNPKTAGQIEQRSRMSAVTSFASATLADVLKPLNDRFASRMSGYNSFVKRNIENFEGGTLSKPESVTISPMGNKAQLIDAIAAEAKITKKDATIEMSWTPISGSGKALDTDIPFIVIYNRSTKEAIGLTPNVTRGGYDIGTVSLPDDKFEPGDVLDAYLAFLREDGTVVFETAYASTTVADAGV